MSYLSVDLDFWYTHTSQKSSKRFFAKLLSLDVPMVVCKHHQFLVSDVNLHQPKDDTLINVDYHSDISSENYFGVDKRLNCGNWVDFIKWRNQGNYIWLYPDYKKCFYERDGICDGTFSQLPFVTGKSHSNYNKWASLKHGKGLKSINLESVERIGIAISPDYYKVGPIRDVLHMLIEKDIPPKRFPIITYTELQKLNNDSSKFHRIKTIDVVHYKQMKNYFVKGE
jgi:hypothetical protein